MTGSPVSRGTVRIGWDYHAFPVWVGSSTASETENDSLNLPEGLKTDLRSWSDDLSALMPMIDVPPDEERAVLSAHDERGLDLAIRVREALGGEWVVIYVSEANGTAEVVAARGSASEPDLSVGLDR